MSVQGPAAGGCSCVGAGASSWGVIMWGSIAVRGFDAWLVAGASRHHAPSTRHGRQVRGCCCVHAERLWTCLRAAQIGLHLRGHHCHDAEACAAAIGEASRVAACESGRHVGPGSCAHNALGNHYARVRDQRRGCLMHVGAWRCDLCAWRWGSRINWVGGPVAPTCDAMVATQAAIVSYLRLLDEQQATAAAQASLISALRAGAASPDASLVLPFVSAMCCKAEVALRASDPGK